MVVTVLMVKMGGTVKTAKMDGMAKMARQGHKALKVKME